MNRTRLVRDYMIERAQEAYNAVQDGHTDKLPTEAELIEMAQIEKPWNAGAGRDTQSYPIYILEDCAKEALEEA